MNSNLKHPLPLLPADVLLTGDGSKEAMTSNATARNDGGADVKMDHNGDNAMVTT